MIAKKEEGYNPIPKNCCPECKKQMTKLNEVGTAFTYKCFKCGIEVEVR